MDPQNRLLAAPVILAAETATLGNPITLFEVGDNRLTTDTLDGGRFLLVERVAPPPPITVVLNWRGRRAARAFFGAGACPRSRNIGSSRESTGLTPSGIDVTRSGDGSYE